MQPSSFIVPLFVNINAIPTFIGTGFFVDHKNNIMITAFHVIRDLGEKFIFSAVVPSSINDRIMPWFDCSVVSVFPEIDMAILTTDSYCPDYKIKIPIDDEIRLNEFVVCHEFSDTRIKEKHIIQSQAASRIGNVTRMLDRQDILGKAGDDVLELSFPALKGASGAPVIYRGSFELCGIILQNVQYELLPLQIETVLDEKNDILEERKYMLPQALALNIKHIRRVLNDLA